jgi:hypothetical protein
LASVEVMNGKLKASQVSAQIERDKLIDITLQLLNLIYQYSAKELPTAIDKVLVDLPGGKKWFDEV